MPIICTQIRGAVNEPHEEILKKARDRLGISADKISELAIYKSSLDARHQNDIHFVYSVFISLKSAENEKRLCGKDKSLTYIEPSAFNPVISKKARQGGEIVIAGFGPAGMFCALTLAEYGYKPIVVERGEPVEERVRSVDKFWKQGELNESSNVQFGEGGAGTFSDGKLTTRINDPLCRYVLEKLVELGAPQEILTKAKPHIGTDKLRDVVKSVRERVRELGGEVRFLSELEDIEIANGEITSCRVGEETIPTEALVLAIGHSARDTFEMLVQKSIFVEPKPFSVGVRIEHRQTDVDESLYGKQAGNPLLPKGEYQLSTRDRSGRAGYTFCMCPGGSVVASSSEAGGVVTNGMSEFARNGENANSAVAVAVSPSDYGLGALDGVEFARSIERKAFTLGGGGYNAPSANVGAFLRGEKQSSLCLDYIKPTYAIGLEPCDFGELFPKPVTDMLRTSISDFGRKMHCFANPNAVLTAPETRTSSPIRITRTEEMHSVSCRNLYPAGEGAGYAGGIMSASVDGIKCALRIMESVAP